MTIPDSYRDIDDYFSASSPCIMIMNTCYNEIQSINNGDPRNEPCEISHLTSCISDSTQPKTTY